MQVPGADVDKHQVPDESRYVKTFAAGRLPKLQSFKSAMHSTENKILLVGGR